MQTNRSSNRSLAYTPHTGQFIIDELPTLLCVRQHGCTAAWRDSR